MSPDEKKNRKTIARAGLDAGREVRGADKPGGPPSPVEAGGADEGQVREPSDKAGAAFSATQSLATRLDRERRRAVRAEARLAEIELALRRTLGDGNGEGVSAGELRALLDAVEMRLVTLDDELKAGERELSYLQETQRIDRSSLASGEEDLARTLEETRRDLSEAMRLDGAGLPELARQKMEFEVEMDRLQSLLSYRDTVCEGLAEELQQGTRVTAEVTGHLADLSRGRVAAAHRRPTVDARVAALRRDLEAEQGRLHQTRRALEAARAEARSAQQTANEAEQRATDRIAAMNRERLEREGQHARQESELEGSLAEARERESEARRKLHGGEAERHGQELEIEALKEETAALRRELELSPESREPELRMRLEASVAKLEETESERIRLAERVSLLQAALSAKAASEKKDTGTSPEPGRARVLSLVPKRPVPSPEIDALEEEVGAREEAERGVERLEEKFEDRLEDRLEEREDIESAPSEPAPVDLMHERENEIDQLSTRWRELQGSYQDALAEFDDMKQKRDNLFRRLNASGPVDGPDVDDDAAVIEPVGEAAEIESLHGQAAASIGSTEAVFFPNAGADSEVAESSDGSICVIHWEDAGERIELVRARAQQHPQCGYVRTAADMPAGSSPLVVLNLLAEEVDPFAALPALAGSSGSIPVLTYCASGGRGYVLGLVEFFPAPFKPEICAQRLLHHPQNCRRVLAVGEAIEALSSLREIMGRARCSTAVAFDGGQALELAPLVRPSFTLVDLSLPAADAIRVFRELRGSAQPDEMAFGATWTRPMDADVFRRELERSLTVSTYSSEDLDAALEHALGTVGSGNREAET